MATADLPSIADLTPDAKRQLLSNLVSDLASTQPGPLSVVAAGRTYYLYEVPANAGENAQRFIDSCSPEHWAEIERRAADDDPRHWMSVEELLRIMPEGSEGSDRSLPRSTSEGG